MLRSLSNMLGITNNGSADENENENNTQLLNLEEIFNSADVLKNIEDNIPLLVQENGQWFNDTLVKLNKDKLRLIRNHLLERIRNLFNLDTNIVIQGRNKPEFLASDIYLLCLSIAENKLSETICKLFKDSKLQSGETVRSMNESVISTDILYNEVYEDDKDIKIKYLQSEVVTLNQKVDFLYSEYEKIKSSITSRENLMAARKRPATCIGDSENNLSFEEYTKSNKQRKAYNFDNAGDTCFINSNFNSKLILNVIPKALHVNIDSNNTKDPVLLKTRNQEINKNTPFSISSLINIDTSIFNKSNTASSADVRINNLDSATIPYNQVVKNNVNTNNVNTISRNLNNGVIAVEKINLNNRAGTSRIINNREENTNMNIRTVNANENRKNRTSNAIKTDRNYYRQYDKNRKSINYAPTRYDWNTNKPSSNQFEWKQTSKQSQKKKNYDYIPNYYQGNNNNNNKKSKSVIGKSKKGYDEIVTTVPDKELIHIYIGRIDESVCDNKVEEMVNKMNFKVSEFRKLKTKHNRFKAYSFKIPRYQSKKAFNCWNWPPGLIISEYTSGINEKSSQHNGLIMTNLTNIVNNNNVENQSIEIDAAISNSTNNNNDINE